MAEPLVLPDQVRRRVAGYAAEAVRAMPATQVPASLRFAIRWRAGPVPRGFIDRLAKTMSQDSQFRHAVGSHLAESDPLAAALLEGQGDIEGDPAAVAALVYIIRPPGWRTRLEALIGVLAAPPSPLEELAAAQREIEGLRSRLEKAKQRRDRDLGQARQAEAEAHGRLSEVVERLREQLVQARSDLAEAVFARDRLQSEVVELERETRRLRSQVEQSKAQAEQVRVADKDARLAASARARVLLEVLQEAVSGLASELALPRGSAAPADLVPADTPSAPTLVKRLASTAELAAALALPRCHLIVDGYNISMGSWPQASLQQQRERLITALASLQSRTGAEITVVFDGAEVGGVPAVTSKAVRVRFSRPGELADRVVVRLVAAEPQGRPIVVASSDAALTSGARAAQARTVEREVLAAMLGVGR